MATALSVCCALGAAALFGISSVFQQAAAQREGGLPVVGLQVIRRLARRPRWILAVSLAAFSFGVQAVALAFGPIALVQPLAATDLLFALPLLAHRQRQALRPWDWMAAAMVVGGVSGFLAASPPSAGSVAPALAAWAWIIAGAGSVVAVMVAVAIGLRGTARAVLLAAGGAVVFAVVDALTKAVVGLVDHRGAAVFASWEPYALLVAGVTAMVLAQGAYRAGPLLTSLPIIDTVEPVGAVLIGATAFREHLGGSAALWSAQLSAAAVAVAGIILLDRSPLMATTSRLADGDRENPARAAPVSGVTDPPGLPPPDGNPEPRILHQTEGPRLSDDPSP